MKIVITVEEFDPDKGYLEYYLARELTKLGHKVCVFTFGRGMHVSKMMLNEGFEVISVPSIAVVNGIHVPSFIGAASILRFIKVEKPDIIHCQPTHSLLSLIFVFLQRLSKSKIVGSVITGEYSINSTVANLKYILAKILTEGYVRNKVETFFAINDGWKEILLQLFNIPNEKVETIPLGADHTLFNFNKETRFKMRKLLGLSLDDLVVVYSGKMKPSKDLHTLLRAVGPIIRQNPKVKLLIIGNGASPYINYLHELSSSLKISNHVIFHSWVHRTRLPDFYSASDIAVWPGSASISILEAASVGLPLIIKDSIITKFALANGNGFSFKHGKINELRKCLEALIFDPKLRGEMGRKSRLLIEERLNWESITKRFLAEYMSPN